MEEFPEAHVKAEKAKARELRKSVWWANKTQNAACYYCGAVLKPTECTMDHIVPVSRGGKSTKGNVVVACKDCNNHKKDLTAVEWDDFLAGKLAERPK